MSTAAVITRAAAVLLGDEQSRRIIGWIIAALFAPVIVAAALLCTLSAGGNAVELCFQSGPLPAGLPPETQTAITEMRAHFAALDSSIAELQAQMEDGGSLDAVRVKAIFYALFSGGGCPEDVCQIFAGCFVTYETRTRTVTAEDADGNEMESTESYRVAVPVTDLTLVYQRFGALLDVEITPQQRECADSVYELIRGGGGSSGWTDGPFSGADGFYSPLGAGWQSRVTSEFGYRICPYHGRELHSGLDMAAPAGTPIRAALGGTVVKSTFHSSYGNYTVIDHGGGLTTGYAHQSQRLVSVGDTVEAGEVIGLVGSTGNSTGAHLHLEVRLNGTLQNPRNYLP